MYSLIIIIMSLLISLSNANPIDDPVRYERGTIEDCIYSEIEDTYITTIITVDGNEWEVGNLRSNLFTDVIVEFSTMGTDTVIDDEITQVIVFNTME